MITFIHTADWQLGKPFERVADPEKRTLLRQERLDAVRRIGAVAREKKASFVVVAGDIFDSNFPTPSVVSAACEAIASIGVPVYVIPGNHDHAGPESVWEQAFFRAESRERAPNLRVLLDFAAVDAGGCVLLPCPLHRRHVVGDPCAWLGAVDSSALGDLPRVVIAHGSTVDFSGESDDDDAPGQPNFIDLDRLPMSAVDYVALGDWHGFARAGDKTWYSGSHETDRFPKTDQVTGHVACVRVGRGLPPTVEGVPTGRTRWLVHEATFSSAEGPALLDAELRSATEAAGASQVLLSLTLRGSLGLEGHAALDALITHWTARLRDLRLDREVRVVPTSEEIDRLVSGEAGPVIAHVAGELVRLLKAGDATGVAGAAVATLHRLATQERSR